MIIFRARSITLSHLWVKIQGCFSACSNPFLSPPASYDCKIISHLQKLFTPFCHQPTAMCRPLPCRYMKAQQCYLLPLAPKQENLLSNYDVCENCSLIFYYNFLEKLKRMLALFCCLHWRLGGRKVYLLDRFGTLGFLIWPLAVAQRNDQ